MKQNLKFRCMKCQKFENKYAGIWGHYKTISVKLCRVCGLKQRKLGLKRGKLKFRCMKCQKLSSTGIWGYYNNVPSKLCRACGLKEKKLKLNTGGKNG